VASTLAFAGGSARAVTSYAGVPSLTLTVVDLSPEDDLAAGYSFIERAQGPYWQFTGAEVIPFFGATTGEYVDDSGYATAEFSPRVVLASIVNVPAIAAALIGPYGVLSISVAAPPLTIANATASVQALDPFASDNSNGLNFAGYGLLLAPYTQLVVTADYSLSILNGYEGDTAIAFVDLLGYTYEARDSFASWTDYQKRATVSLQEQEQEPDRQRLRDAGSLELLITNDTANEDRAFFVVGASTQAVAAIPEAQSAALLAAGLVPVMWMLQRSRRRIRPAPAP
jgi:hypothetical protein